VAALLAIPAAGAIQVLVLELWQTSAPPGSPGAQPPGADDGDTGGGDEADGPGDPGPAGSPQTSIS
jgi:hypothetical protein